MGSLLLMILTICINVSCQGNNSEDENLIKVEVVIDSVNTNPGDVDVPNYKLPNIDLSHWKVTLPIGKPTEVAPPEILSYATNETLKPFFYNDSIKGTLVFYTYPNTSTTNSSYSRTELREQLVPGSNSTNWTFSRGGTMKGTLEVSEMSKDINGDYYRSIIMQIHGILTNAQKTLIGAADNNAPPMLKIYWVNGQVRVKTKVLKDLNATDKEMLYTDAWGDDAGYTFPEYVGFNKFTLEIKVSNGRMEVILNEKASIVYDNIHTQKWGVFENYFKAGNYLQSKDKDSYAKVKYYELVVTH